MAAQATLTEADRIARKALGLDAGDAPAPAPSPAPAPAPAPAPTEDADTIARRAMGMAPQGREQEADAIARRALGLTGGAGAPAPVAAPAPVEDTRSITDAMKKAVKRGVRQIPNTLEGIVDPVEANKKAAKLNEQSPRVYPNFADAKGFEESTKSLLETAAESAPATGAGIAAALGAAALGAPAIAAGAVGGLVTAPLTFGGIKMDAQEATGETSNVLAGAGAGLVAALDSFLPARIARAVIGPVAKNITTSYLAAATKAGFKGGVTELATEGMQTAIEKIAAVPERARVLYNPKTPAERQQQARMFNEIAEGGLVGMLIGGPTGAAGGVAEARRARRPEPRDGASPNPLDAARTTRVNDYMVRLGLVESGNKWSNPNPEPGASADGRWQFTDDTWVRFMRREEPDLTKGLSNAAVIKMRANPRLQTKMMHAYTDDSVKALEAAELPVANGTLGVLHRFGQAGGVKILKAAQANPDTRIDTLLSKRGMDMNPDLKTEKLNTVGEILSWYEQKLGMGMTYDRTGRDGIRLGAADVKTVDDPTGAQFRNLSVGQSAQVGADLFEQALQDLLNSDADTRYAEAVAKAKEDGKPAPTAPTPAERDRIPEASRVKLAQALETPPVRDSAAPELPPSGQRTLARIMEVADGIQTVDVGTVSAAQVQQAAVTVLERLGYGRTDRTPGNYDSAAETSDLRARGKTDPDKSPRWKIANSLRLAFSLLNDNENLGRITADSGGRVIAQSLRALGAVEAAKAQSGSIAAKNQKGPKRRTTAKAATQAARLQALFERGAEAIDYLSEPPSAQAKNKAFTDAPAARTAVLDMFEGTAANRTSQNIAKLLTDFTPMMTRERSSPSGKGYYTFFKRIEKLAESAGAVDPATREAIRTMFKTSDRRASDLKNQLAEQAESRVAGRETERALRNELMAKDLLEWEQSISNIKDAQTLNSVDRLIASAPMLLDLVQGNNAKIAEYNQPTRKPGWIYRAFAATGALPLGMDVLGLNNIDSEIAGKFFTAITLNGRRQSPIRHILQAGTKSQGRARAHVGDVERAEKILAASVKGTKAERHEQMRVLTAITQKATSARLSAADVDSKGDYVPLQKYFDAMDDGSYKQSWADRDPNGRLAREDADGNWSYGDSHAAIVALAGELEALPMAQRQAYVRVRALFRNSMLDLLLGIVNNARRALGLPVVQKVADSTKLVNAMTAHFEGDPTLTAETQDIMTSMARGILEGDYFPMQRIGSYSVFARQPIVIRGVDEASVRAQAITKKNESPFIQYENRASTATPVQDPTTGNWTVNMEVAFYGQFVTEAEAEAARASLLDDTPLTGLTPDEIKTQRYLMPEFNVAEGGVVSAVLRVGSDVDVSRAGGLTEAQAAKLLGAAKDDVDVKNALIELLPDRRLAAALRHRKDVLGAPPLMTEILRTREPGVAAALGRVSVQQDTRDIFFKMNEQLARTKVAAANAVSGAERKRLEQRANGQKLLIDYLEKRTTEVTKPILGDAINQFMSRVLTAWFIASVSNVAMNLVQVTQFGVPAFNARYGPGAGVRLQATNTLAFLTTLKAFAKVRATKFSKSSNREAIDYFSDGREIDARHFSTNDREAGGVRINTAAETRALVWDEIAGQPLPNQQNFEVDEFGAPKVFLLSQHEFDQYRRGEITHTQMKALSNGRKGGHLSAVFVEEARITKLRDMSLQEGVGAALSKAANMVFDFTTIAPAIVEYANRKAVVLATLDAETKVFAERGITGDLDDSLMQEVERAASQLNDTTNANYTTVNRSVLQKKMGFFAQFTTLPAAITMKLWQLSHSMVYGKQVEGGYTRVEAMKFTAGLFVIGALVSGGRGALAVFIEAILNGGLASFAWLLDPGDDDEDAPDSEKGVLELARKYDARTAIEMAIRQESQFLGDLWSKGPLSMATGADLQSRLGFNQFPLRVDMGLTFDKNSLGSMALSLLGPAGALAGTAGEMMLEYNTNGEVSARTLQNLAPKQVRDIWRASDFNAGKGYRDSRGNVLMQDDEMASANSVFNQIAGFTPNKVAELNAARFAEIRRDIRVKAARQNVMRLWNMNPDDRTQAMVALREFNAKHSRNPITAAALEASMKKHIMDEVIRGSLTSGLGTRDVLASMQLAENMGLTRYDAEAAVDPSAPNADGFEQDLLSSLLDDPGLPDEDAQRDDELTRQFAEE